MTVRYFNCDYFHWYSVYFATSGDNEHGGQPVLEDRAFSNSKPWFTSTQSHSMTPITKMAKYWRDFLKLHINLL
jgi:hypothetical protein